MAHSRNIHKNRNAGLISDRRGHEMYPLKIKIWTSFYTFTSNICVVSSENIYRWKFCDRKGLCFEGTGLSWYPTCAYLHARSNGKGGREACEMGKSAEGGKNSSGKEEGKREREKNEAKEQPQKRNRATGERRRRIEGKGKRREMRHTCQGHACVCSQTEGETERERERREEKGTEKTRREERDRNRNKWKGNERRGDRWWERNRKTQLTIRKKKPR